MSLRVSGATDGLGESGRSRVFVIFTSSGRIHRCRQPRYGRVRLDDRFSRAIRKTLTRRQCCALTLVINERLRCAIPFPWIWGRRCCRTRIPRDNGAQREYKERDFIETPREQLNCLFSRRKSRFSYICIRARRFLRLLNGHNEKCFTSHTSASQLLYYI